MSNHKERVNERESTQEAFEANRSKYQFDSLKEFNEQMKQLNEYLRSTKKEVVKCGS